MRRQSLDVLRAVAVVSVLCFHTLPAGGYFQRTGWAGVDLFFALSGYLVTQLIVNEYKRTGQFNAARFIVRRGVKIYPLFWLLIAFTAVTRPHMRPLALIGELTFTQCYLPGLWAHTWSLAVEEHFYLALSLTAWAFARSATRWPSSNKWLAYCAFVVAVVVFLRVAVYLLARHDLKLVYCGTHGRLDTLALGALLAISPRSINGRKLLTATLPAAAYAAWVGLAAPFTVGIGITAIGCTCVALVQWALTWSPRPALRPVAWIGRYSYAIYLFHLPVGTLLHAYPPVVRMLASVAVGCALSAAVEQPLLRLRDAVLARRNGAVVLQ